MSRETSVRRPLQVLRQDPEVGPGRADQPDQRGVRHDFTVWDARYQPGKPIVDTLWHVRVHGRLDGNGVTHGDLTSGEKDAKRTALTRQLFKDLARDVATQDLADLALVGDSNLRLSPDLKHVSRCESLNAQALYRNVRPNLPDAKPVTIEVLLAHDEDLTWT